jgi:hypothetical protein
MTEKVEPEKGPEPRLAYEPPAVTWVEPLEVQPSLMGGCGKITDADCAASPPPQS